jgi:hypothetical protein
MLCGWCIACANQGGCSTICLLELDNRGGETLGLEENAWVQRSRLTLFLLGGGWIEVARAAPLVRQSYQDERLS